METWCVVEYTYSKLESDKIVYKGRKEFDTIEEVEKFVSVVCFLSKANNKINKFQQIQLFKKHFGMKGKFVGLRKIYKYTKKEIQLNNNKNDSQRAINM